MHITDEVAKQTSLIQEILQSLSWNDHCTSFVNLFMVQGTRLVAIDSYNFKKANYWFLTFPH